MRPFPQLQLGCTCRSHLFEEDEGEVDEDDDDEDEAILGVWGSIFWLAVRRERNWADGSSGARRGAIVVAGAQGRESTVMLFVEPR